MFQVSSHEVWACFFNTTCVNSQGPANPPGASHFLVECLLSLQKVYHGSAIGAVHLCALCSAAKSLKPAGARLHPVFV